MKLIKVLFLVPLFLSTYAARSQVVPKEKEEFTSLEEARKVPDKVKKLDLSNQVLGSFPIGLNVFKNLQYLSLRNDHLKEGPKEMLELSRLKVLDLSGNDFESLPVEFSKLENLEQLYLDDEKNFKIEKSIDNLGLGMFKNLQYLSLRNDHLKFVPDEILKLKTLRVLDLSGNDFERLPMEFSKLENLEELFLDRENNFKLDENIDQISSLSKLKILHLEHDNIKLMPKDLERLAHLEKLYLGNNKLKYVPKEIKGLKNLKYLGMQGNPVLKSKSLLPPENNSLKIAF